MSHLSHLKQMYSQSIQLTHELILCIQITRGRVHFNRDSTAKSPCWHRVLNLWPSNPDLLWFAAVPSLQDLAIFMAPHGRAPFKWPVLWGTALQQSPASCLEHSPDFCRAGTTWKSLPPICLAYKLPRQSPAWFCQQHLEFPSSLPSKYYPGPMLLNFSIQMGTGVSNMAWSAEELYSINFILEL